MDGARHPAQVERATIAAATRGRAAGGHLASEEAEDLDEVAADGARDGRAELAGYLREGQTGCARALLWALGRDPARGSTERR